ncbi:ComEA family DNA-binding protein [Lutibacter sp.]
MNSLKFHFGYNKRQRNGILFLLLIIVLLQTVFFFVDFSSNETINLSEKEIALFQKEFDSLKAIELENEKFKVYLFNPNFITDFKGYQLGMSIEEIDRLHSYRKKGSYVNSIRQFQEVTKIGDSLLNIISPYFKFPEWATTKKTFQKNELTNSVKKLIVKQDINAIEASDLRIVNGIGEKLADRIIAYRTRLRGFSFDNQLYEVWNIDKEVIDRVLQRFEVVKPPVIQKININEATFKQVLAIVYIDYELTKKIFNYRDEVAEIQSLEELKKIDGFPIEKFNRIALYLVAE